MPDLRDRAVSIVRHRLNQQRHAAWAITLVRDLFVIDSFFFTRTTTNRTLDRVVGHVSALRIEDCFAQTRVGVRVTAAAARRDGDLFNKLREQLAALGVERAFLVLNTVP